MAGRRITPKQKESALILRASGYTLAVIAEKTDISVSSLKRLFSSYSVSRGEIKQNVIEKAKDQLLSDANTIANIKQEAASLLLDDLALAKRLRSAMALAAESLEAKSTTEALQVMRAVSAGAVALKSTSETLRKSLGLDKNDELSDELPELVVTVMTEDDLVSIRQEARSRLVGFDDGLDGLLASDSYENEEFDDDVIEDGFEPEEIPI